MADTVLLASPRKQQENSVVLLKVEILLIYLVETLFTLNNKAAFGKEGEE